MSGGAASRRKGSRIEREIVNRHREIGIHAERVPLSDADKGSFAGDVIVAEMVAEVKARSGGSGFKTLERRLILAPPQVSRQGRFHGFAASLTNP